MTQKFGEKKELMENVEKCLFAGICKTKKWNTPKITGSQMIQKQKKLKGIGIKCRICSIVGSLTFSEAKFFSAGQKFPNLNHKRSKSKKKSHELE